MNKRSISLCLATTDALYVILKISKNMNDSGKEFVRQTLWEKLVAYSLNPIVPKDSVVTKSVRYSLSLFELRNEGTKPPWSLLPIVLAAIAEQWTLTLMSTKKELKLNR